MLKAAYHRTMEEVVGTCGSTFLNFDELFSDSELKYLASSAGISFPDDSAYPRNP